MKPKNRTQEEFWNVLTHGVGAVLALVALGVLVGYTATHGTRLHLAVSIVFGLSLVLLYTASTIYHAVVTLRHKKLWQRIDHLSIYVLIAGTYTPVMLVGLQGVWGWTLFSLIWVLVVVGFVFKFSKYRYNEKISLTLYAVMGWLCVIGIQPLMEALSSTALLLIGLGGVCYTVGIYFYAKDHKRFYHPIWHVFVLGGSAFHFFAVFHSILP
ncbi:MAG: hypothetical protein RL607_2346 [Bacteroidota bacterium]|jgi:hemolysin III